MSSAVGTADRADWDVLRTDAPRLLDGRPRAVHRLHHAHPAGDVGQLTRRSAIEGCSDVCPSDDHLPDLGGAVPDLKSEHGAQPLLERMVVAVAAVPMGQETLMNDLV